MMNDKWRLGLHLMPPTGWLNDPNGLCQFGGEYHFFFQYSPDEVNGGIKNWGHYISKDLLNWEFAGVALKPEKEFESRGVYSGSALIDDGKMHIYYTGNVKLAGDYNYVTNGRENNTLYVCSEDGRTFGEKKCLLRQEHYPENLSCHVRDPKVVTGKSLGFDNEKDYMFLGARTKADVGEVLVYESDNKLDWVLANILESEEPFGYMWECPDAFVIGGKKLLSISPQGVETQGINYQNLYQSGYYVVDGNYIGRYKLKSFKEWDRGFDFYAPQTFEDNLGRRILVGWIGMPDVPEQKNPTVEYGWQNALTVPREVTVKNDKIAQWPVAELETLRGKKHTLPLGVYSEEMKMYDVEIDLRENADFEIIVSEGMHLNYRKDTGIFTLSFDEKSGMGYGRKSRSVQLESCRQVRLLVDTSCIEVYINGGEEVFTSRFYTENGMSCFKAEGADCAIAYYTLAPFNIK